MFRAICSPAADMSSESSPQAEDRTANRLVESSFPKMFSSSEQTCSNVSRGSLLDATTSTVLESYAPRIVPSTSGPFRSAMKRNTNWQLWHPDSLLALPLEISVLRSSPAERNQLFYSNVDLGRVEELPVGSGSDADARRDCELKKVVQVSVIQVP